MKTIEIKNVSGQVLYTAENVGDIKMALEMAVRARANLTHANLAGAYLADANLAGAYLAGANLARADLTRANLAYAKNFNPHRVNHLSILQFQTGNIRAFKMVDADLRSPIQRSHQLTYEIGKTLKVENSNINPTDDCGAGINVATLPWVLANWQYNARLLLVEFDAQDIAAIPVGSGKFRVSKCKVIREIDLTEIGINSDGRDVVDEDALIKKGS